MTRGEFLESLRIALQGKMSQGSVNEHLRYYENYIMLESRKGRTEQEVLDSLGDPRLIAKTLADAELNRGQGGFRAGARADMQGESQDQKTGLGGFRFGSWFRKRTGALDGSQSDAQDSKRQYREVRWEQWKRRR